MSVKSIGTELSPDRLPPKRSRIGVALQNRPRLLEVAYKSTAGLFKTARPLLERLGFERVNKLIDGPEEFTKKVMFDCKMCGQCVLHSTGMTCPMTCPKNLRNGPCGGVRQNGNCEVVPDMKCVWVMAFERSQKMGAYGADMMVLNPPVNRTLEGESAWVNMVTGVDKDVPEGWVGLSTVAVVPKSKTPWS